MSSLRMLSVPRTGPGRRSNSSLKYREVRLPVVCCFSTEGQCTRLKSETTRFDPERRHMRDTRIYKVRRKSDGLFATRHHGFGGIHWTELGTMWKGSGVMKRAFKTSLKEVILREVDIVLFEIKEVEVVKLKDLKSISKK